MKNAVMLLALASSLIPVSVHAKVIYGEDNRVEVSEATEFQQKLARSAATMVSEKKMTRDPSKPGLVQLDQQSLADWINSASEEESSKLKLFTPKLAKTKNAPISFCEGERFVSQPNPGMCSGFLIAPDLIVTAGHCVELENFCSEYKWVFDFKVDPVTKKAGIDIKEEDVYSCKRVVSNALSMPLGLDYGMIQLDRPVTGREPLEIRNEKNVDNFANLVLIGSPSGLPLKVAAGAVVRNNTHPFFFTTNTDSYQGNSGSAVLNAETGVVEGILVRGEEDFKPNRLLMCLESNRCPKEGCRGEDVSRLTSIPEIGVQLALYKAAETGDIETLENLTKLNIWVDIYGKNRESALMKAAKARQQKSMELLIAKGADVNLTDVNGDSTLHIVAPRLNVDRVEMVSLLVKNQVNLELKNNKGETALLVAANANNVGGANILIQAGAERNAVDNKGENVLFAFARAGNMKAVDQLIRLGVDPTLKNAEGKTILEIKDTSADTKLK